MKKKRPYSKGFKSVSQMDRYLEREDLGVFFKRYGKLKKPIIKKINLDLPSWLLDELDKEANLAGVSRQPLIKLWLLQKLEEERKKRTIAVK